MELARETWVHAREEGADRVTAGLAALRAAAQKHGIEQEHGRDVASESTQGDAAEPESIRERLALIVGRNLRADDISQKAEMDTIRDRLNQVLGRDKPDPSKRHQQNLEKDRERERQRQIEMGKPHKKIGSWIGSYNKFQNTQVGAV